jgi:hypothetical protein
MAKLRRGSHTATVILRSAPFARVSKDGRRHSAEHHPSRLAEDGEHLRMTLLCVVAAQKIKWRFNKLPRQCAMIHHDSDPSVNLSKPLQKTRLE